MNKAFTRENDDADDEELSLPAIPAGTKNYMTPEGYRRNQPLLGKPDFTFKRERVVVFVDGCFWHGCPRCYKRPGSNQEFWDAKIANNRNRDRLVGRGLRREGWNVVRIWQHQLDKPARVAGLVNRALAIGLHRQP